MHNDSIFVQLGHKKMSENFSSFSFSHPYCYRRRNGSGHYQRDAKRLNRWYLKVVIMRFFYSRALYKIRYIGLQSEQKLINCLVWGGNYTASTDSGFSSTWHNTPSISSGNGSIISAAYGPVYGEVKSISVGITYHY